MNTKSWSETGPKADARSNDGIWSWAHPDRSRCIPTRLLFRRFFDDGCEFLGELNLFYYDGNAVRILNDLMFLPFSTVALAIGTAAFITGAGLGSWRGL